MTRYSTGPRVQIFVKGYRFLSLARNIRKNIGKTVSKNLSSKYSQKLIDHGKQSATDALKTASRRVIQITAKGSGDSIYIKIGDKITKLICNKIADKITDILRCLPQNSLETVKSERENTGFQRKILKEGYSQKKGRKLFLIPD